MKKTENPNKDLYPYSKFMINLAKQDKDHLESLAKKFGITQAAVIRILLNPLYANTIMMKQIGFSKISKLQKEITALKTIIA